jgi:hypothetical protein
MVKTLVLYVFHQYNERVKNFIQNGGIFYDENIDFIFISNNKHNVFDVPPYVKTFVRDNIGFDFGGWSDALLTNDLYKGYDNFIFVNSSVIGPFIDTGLKWTDAYLNGLTTNNVKLFGSTINTIQLPHLFAHVQSYIFAMDKTTLEFLIQCEIFSNTKYAKTLEEAVFFNELAMSRRIIANGWNIGSLLHHYNGVDFTFRSPLKNNIPFLGDVMYPAYCNTLWNVKELIFIKGNRFSS